jgi:hypothetical protein
VVRSLLPTKSRTSSIRTGVEGKTAYIRQRRIVSSEHVEPVQRNLVRSPSHPRLPHSADYSYVGLGALGLPPKIARHLFRILIPWFRPCFCLSSSRGLYGSLRASSQVSVLRPIANESICRWTPALTRRFCPQRWRRVETELTAVAHSSFRGRDFCILVLDGVHGITGRKPYVLNFSSRAAAASSVSGFLQNANRTCCAPSLACL